MKRSELFFAGESLIIGGVDDALCLVPGAKPSNDASEPESQAAPRTALQPLPHAPVL